MRTFLEVLNWQKAERYLESARNSSSVTTQAGCVKHPLELRMFIKPVPCELLI